MKLFHERLDGHHAQVLTVDAVLHRGRTALQDVLVFENRAFGRVLALDGVVQLTERDHHVYHEMIAHVPLLAHGAARRVLIIGGGDGGTLKEVLKHPVEQVVLVEIDPEVIALAQRLFPEVSDGAFEDARVSVVIGDGAEYVARGTARFDVIIIDSTDPAGPADGLFTPAFYRACARLLRPGGLLTLQSGASFVLPEQVDAVCRRLTPSFHVVRPFLAPVPTYAAGTLALVGAGQGANALTPPIAVLRERVRRTRLITRYYTPDVHHAAFALPPTLTQPPRRARAGAARAQRSAADSSTATVAAVEAV